MCGIAGIWDINGRLADEALSHAAQAMASALTHRGPDAGGLWSDEKAGLALAHRRLSILDLSPHGAQPMLSACGRYALCYNGEIYNFKALREQLDYPFKGHSDSEVLLAAIAAWGTEKTLPKLHGMFAFALWDRQTQTLTLARDRIGEKPLYYGWTGSAFTFASELHAIRALDGFNAAVSREALTQLMALSYIAAPLSIYEGVHKLPAGHYAMLKADGEIHLSPYWALQDELQQRATSSDETLIDQLEALLMNATKQMMASDVPLGAFLSGGIDSSLITALMQKQSAAPILTFSIGFAESGFDEAPYAKAIAVHLGTQHTELYVDAAQALSVVPKLAQIYDEPFADSSQIPTFLLAQMTRQHVTVALSGDAGDELFGGYNRYRYAPRIWQAIGWLPPAIRRLVAQLPLPARSAKWQKIAAFLPKLAAQDRGAFYQAICQTGHGAQRFVIGGAQKDWPAHAPLPFSAENNFAAWMMAQDTLSYLPDDILVKVDRAAMAVSLETRIPFLHPDIITFANSLPLSAKIRGGQSKWILRQLLYRHVPKSLIERPKAGFAVPLAQWLRGPLKEWSGDLLAPETLRAGGYLQPSAIGVLWQQHQAGTHDHHKLLWNALMFQSWLENQCRA